MPPPPALRPYLSFARLNSRSLDMVARVVDRDDEFRARVAGEVSEDEVGRAGWLWLERPPGWAEELAEIEAEWAAQRAERMSASDERTAARKLAATQEALGRAEAEAAIRGAELAEARADLAREREARSAADRRVAELEAQVVEAAEARAEVVRNLKATEERLVARATELKATKARLRALDDRPPAAGQVAPAPEPGDRSATAAIAALGDPAGPPAAGLPGDAAGAAAGDPAGPPAAGRPGGLGQAAVVAGPGDAGDSGGPTGTSATGPGAMGPDGGLVAREVERAAGGAAALADALERLAAALGATSPGAPASAGPGTSPDRPADAMPSVPGPGSHLRLVDAPAGSPEGWDVDAGAGAAVPVVAPGESVVHSGVDAGEGPAGPGGAAARRVPLVLPGGLLDDTAEAAEHLLRTPGAVLVVDGYNVTMQGWPELSVADQRRRLVTALSGLAARTATRVELVFDGADVDSYSLPTPGRQLLRVRFSEPGVEADDVVIDLVGRIPAATPVVVASSDRRVREGARRLGANLVHAHQLVALVRR